MQWVVVKEVKGKTKGGLRRKQDVKFTIKKRRQDYFLN